MVDHPQIKAAIIRRLDLGTQMVEPLCLSRLGLLEKIRRYQLEF